MEWLAPQFKHLNIINMQGSAVSRRTISGTVSQLQLKAIRAAITPASDRYRNRRYERDSHSIVAQRIWTILGSRDVMDQDHRDVPPVQRQRERSMDMPTSSSQAWSDKQTLPVGPSGIWRRRDTATRGFK